MFYEEINPPDITRLEVKLLIDPFLPNITKNDIKFHYHGTYNVFIVKNEYIFRFPGRNFRNQKGHDLIAREVKVLDILRDKVSTEIPDPLFVSNDPSNPFVGYKMIEGSSLSRVFHQFDRHDQRTIAVKIGDFLTELHSQGVLSEVNNILDKQFTHAMYRDYWGKYHLKTQKVAFHLLSREQQQWIDNLFNDFLGGDNFDFAPVTAHCDFDTSNILVDRSNRLTGVIDFEETGPYDPAVDFLFFSEGKEFMTAILDNYGGQIDSGFHNRMKFHYCRSGLVYITTGIEYNIDPMVEYGLELIVQRKKIIWKKGNIVK